MKSGLLLLWGVLGLMACGAPGRVQPTSHVKRPVPEASPRVVPEVVSALPPRRVKSRPKPRPAAPSRPAQTLSGHTIVVDAGHGGTDPGAPGSPWSEKAIVFDIAKTLAAELSRRGAEVRMTRDRDVKIALDDRAAVADDSGADLLVSIHADAAENTSAHGFGVWIARNARRESVRAAEAVLDAGRRAGLSVRSIHRADFRVLAGHGRPSILVETGFLSNAGDARRLQTSAYRRKIAGVVAEGVARALR